ncbi:zinc finger and SCAN domain-containing protein 12-like [Anopheles marshallii]|uniref:zinc finger and SCAN domain-containing protein 12-like n=1 Tax=Anopheles marshallii TaxID=1521116 RepID=UPI00237BB72A|nr:zinc finger and SCAN domain-containing protein 12-like [Anopheles marshallii]
MSLLTGFSAFDINVNACKICKESYETMGSIICPQTDTKMLEKIYKSTNVRVQPRKGIITPVCEYCRSRIDEYDEDFKPYMVEYDLESDRVSGDAAIDPLACASRNKTHSANDVQDKKRFSKTSSDDGEALALGENWGKMAVLIKPTECTICGKQVKSMADHMRIHKSDKKYKCTFCDKSFAQSNNLTYHIRKHTGERPYQCEICDKKFITNAHLLSHAKFHKDVEFQFQCEICSKLFNHVGNFNKHQRVHSGEKPYRCEFCDMTFNNISNKKLHQKRHRDERNFVCQICSKGFHDAHHLERHQTVHRKRGKSENRKNSA